ncbi:MAG TPA: VWA domain-containing protein [Phnomibacter sp.]|nr:VWA domain-containing protein [Phnomibacter sp.]
MASRQLLPNASLEPQYKQEEVNKVYQDRESREGYAPIVENEFIAALQKPLSTFSIDVDRAAYSNVRRYLNAGTLPPAGAVRIEEMINYFDYSYPQPSGPHPFGIHTQLAKAPWNPNHYLLSIGLQGKQISNADLPPANLVFLIDVSGSMDEPNRLPLVKKSLELLANNLRPQDKVAIVVYAGSAGLVLPATAGSNKAAITEALNKLEAGGSTAGGEGIALAYKVARQNRTQGANSRVIICTDGDFNVGPSSDDELVRMIEKERQDGIFLSVLGFGMGNYQDHKMQQLANKGNGNHAYIDQLQEARKIFMEEFGATLYTIAKDVKLQLEFNPAQVQGYRLIGYENRLLADEDFNDDTKDAGELGTGHVVTALYEIIPAGVSSAFLRTVDPLKYQQQPPVSPTGNVQELLTIKFRYKQPQGSTSQLLQQVVAASPVAIENTDANFRFSAAVAAFGMLLRDSKFKQQASYALVESLARSALGPDPNGYRFEFVGLVKKAANLQATAAK